MKYDLIAEAYVNLLIEGRIDDLKSQNPHLVNEIDSYVNTDPTPQKKFVPWLVSQHKKGNVTPNEPNLNQTLSGFETYKSRHGISDHSSKSYQEIRDAVQPFLGTATTNKDLKKQQIHEGIEQIYSSPDNKIQAFHVKTKEASQHVYGGGKHLGGLHTDWCVSARSKDCLFGKYGPMYTVHVKDDPKSPYAVHLESNKITTRDNNPDEYEIYYGLQKFPHLAHSIGTISHKYRELISNELQDPKINSERLDKITSIIQSAFRYNTANTETTHIAAIHPNPEVAMAALRHPTADVVTIHRAAKHPDQRVRELAQQLQGTK